MAASKYTNGASYTISKGAHTYLGDYLKAFREKHIMLRSISKPWFLLLVMEVSHKEKSLFSGLSGSRPTGKKSLLQICRALALKWGGLGLSLISLLLQPWASLDKKLHECLQLVWAWSLQPLSETHPPSWGEGRQQASLGAKDPL